MIMRHGKIDIPSEKPFVNDKFNREIITDNLESIIDYTEGSLVLSVDSGWGMGKTTFIEMWRRKLDINSKYVTHYFNAWENDNYGDPLLALIGEFEEGINGKSEDTTTLGKIKAFGKPLLKQILPSVLKMATHGALDISKIDLNEFNETQITEIAGKLAEIEISNYRKEKETKFKFKEALVEYQRNQGKKIIFFIDELDRCRPTFAIETLERIKHLFDIDNYIFVLALDKKQLSYSIQTLYGQNMDSDGYLKRFLDLEYYLPDPDINIYCNYLMEHYQLNTSSNLEFFDLYLKELIIFFQLSLRDIEKLFFYLKLIIPITELYNSAKNYKRSYLQAMGAIFSFFSVLKIKRNDLYQGFLNKQYDIKGFTNEVHFERIKISDSIFATTIQKILTMNLSLKTETRKENYIGPDYELFDLNLLVTSKRENFMFIEQFQFIEQFDFKDS